MRHSSIRLDEYPIEIIKLTPLNPLISKCEIKVCYVGDEPNRNRSVITKEVAKKMANSLPGSPIVGLYNEYKEDFEEHSRELKIKDGKILVKDITRPYGFVDLNAKVWFAKYLDDEEVIREYMVTEGYLWTGQYEEAKRITKKGNNHSMELDEDTLDAFWTKDNKGKPKFFILNDAVISKLCVLGDEEEPCFEGSSITAPTIQFSFDDGFKEQLFSMMNELKDLLKGGEEKTMFTRYSVKIGDSLWTALYSYVQDNFASHSIDSVCETEGQTFAILASEDKYFRLNFSIDNENYTFEPEVTEIENYIPEGEPQFCAEDVENYKKLDKTEKEESNKNNKDTEQKEEKKCSKCGKPVDECECPAGPQYSLEQIPEYVELQEKYTTLETNYSALENNYNLLKEEKEQLEKDMAPLAQFKKDYDKKEKQNMIDKFYMLDDEDKKDVIDNIDTYSIDEIESKLSVICVRKKVSFETEPEVKKEPTTYSFNADIDDDETTPAWVKAALQVAKKMN